MWLVRLVGDASTLASLAQSLTNSSLRILQEREEYFLASDRFALSDDANAVYQSAKEVVEILNGASKLGLDAVPSITLGPLLWQRKDGIRDTFLFPEPVTITFHVIAPSVRLTSPDGTVEESRPADAVREWTELALKNDAIANVFRLLGSGTLDWVNLYRIFEIVCSDIEGLNVIEAKGWATKASMTLFKHTANSPSASGLDARHGAETQQPPMRPMSISEARALMSTIVHAWLRDKITDSHA